MNIHLSKRGITFFLLFPTFCSPLLASPIEHKLSIDGFEVIKRSYDSVQIEVAISGNAEPLCASAVAKSKDGIIRSHTALPRVLIPKQGKQTLALDVYAPSSTSSVTTQSLLINLYSCDGAKKIARKYDWPYQWQPFQASDPYLNDARLSADIFADNIYDLDFEAVELLLKKWQGPKAKDMNGDWNLNGFHQGAEANCDTAHWAKSLLKFQEWETIHAPIAQLVEAQCWIRYAWDIRGDPYRKKIDPYAMELFMSRMEKAEQLLQGSQAIKLKGSSPLWYVTYLTIAIDMRKDSQFIEGLFNEAIKKYPSYHPLYAVMTEYWAPYAGDPNWTKLNNLVNTATAYAFETDQDSTYARLYLIVSRRQRPEADIFNTSLISWPKMRTAFEAIITKYPSATNLNNYASLACRANDKNTFLTLRAKIGDQVIPHLWMGHYSPDVCEHRFLQKI